MPTHIQSRVDLCYTEMPTHMHNRVDLCYTEIPTQMIIAYTIPAVFISFMLTGNPIPQLGLGSEMADGSTAVLVVRFKATCLISVYDY
jgi:hypothetical protein